MWEMLNGNQRPICVWETSSMEEDSYCPCCCGEEEKLHRQNTLIQLLHKREKRLTRKTYFLTVALLLVISAALTILVAVLLGVRARETPDSQIMRQPKRNPSDMSLKQQGYEIRNMCPSAMVTVPDGNHTNGTYLQWQSELGNAHCQGGLNCSSGYLVVPRDGIYKLYLQITYEDDNPCHETLIIMVFVFEEAYAKDRLLLSSYDTLNSKTGCKKSLHTSSLFDLKANSILRVKSTCPELIVKSEDATFFGVELQQSMSI